MMHVRVVRRGGLAGIALRGEVETAQLPDDQAQASEAALRALPADKPAAAPRHPDGFQYEIEFSEPGGETRSVALDEAEISAQVRPLLEAALKGGTLG
jgi:hypothetical protein